MQQHLHTYTEHNNIFEEEEGGGGNRGQNGLIPKNEESLAEKVKTIRTIIVYYRISAMQTK